MITRVRGTEDILSLGLYNLALEKMKKHLHLYNFSEIDTPILEPTELFVRSIGKATDIVSKEMYIFQTSSGESICLRPEGTASVIRAYVENRVAKAPWKVFSHGPMFRHERPQKGRWRQFTQFNMEIVNAPSIEHDAQFIKLLDNIFSNIFKLENYSIKLNFLGCLGDRKAHKTALLKFLDNAEDQICQTCKTRKNTNILRIFDCKNEECKQIYLKAPKITDHLCPNCSSEWENLQTLLDILSVSYVIDPTLVRGLDYYYNTVFEFSSRDLGAQNAFCGGGRYSLGKEVGAKEDFPSVGAAIGMGRLMLLIEQNLQKFPPPQSPVLHVIVPITEEQKTLSLLLSQELQAQNLCCDAILEVTSPSKMMKKANKMGAKFAIIIGPEEQQQGTVSIKNMQMGETTVVKQTEAAKFLLS